MTNPSIPETLLEQVTGSIPVTAPQFFSRLHLTIPAPSQRKLLWLFDFDQ
jgi:hypothetical protein